MPKILIVDDEAHIRLLLEQSLEEFEDVGVEIMTASNGREAFEMIQANHPDLVFLDVMMPEMNGYDVCLKVKRELGMTGVYIIMLTAKGQEFDRKKGIDYGADLYMTKPFDPDVIVDKTAEVLGIRPE
ncbi:MAG: response regulator [Acidobacteria bacterium]|nr:response regulator [Acidobacteriota bacterium]